MPENPIYVPANYPDNYLGERLQYKRKKPFEAFYNIIATGYDGHILRDADRNPPNNITGIRAINLKGVFLEKEVLGIKALDRTSFGFSYREGTSRFLMKRAVLFLKKGDWIFENTAGATIDNPPLAVPGGSTPRWEVEDIQVLGDRVGRNKKNQLQVIITQLRTNL